MTFVTGQGQADGLGAPMCCGLGWDNAFYDHRKPRNQIAQSTNNKQYDTFLYKEYIQLDH